jgi:hypothetical protein
LTEKQVKWSHASCVPKEKEKEKEKEKDICI